MIIENNIPHPKYNAKGINIDKLLPIIIPVVEQQNLTNQFNKYTREQMTEFWMILQNNTRPQLCKLIQDYFTAQNWVIKI